MRYRKATILVLFITFLAPLGLSNVSAATPLPMVNTFTYGSLSNSEDGFTVNLLINQNPGVVTEASYASKLTPNQSISLLPITLDEDQLNSANVQLIVSYPAWYQSAWSFITGQGLPYLSSCALNITDTDLGKSVFSDSITATPITNQSISIPNYQLQYAGNYKALLNCQLSNGDTIGDLNYVYVPSSSATVDPKQIDYTISNVSNSSGGYTVYTTLLNNPGFQTNGSVYGIYNPIGISSEDLGADGFNILTEYGLAKDFTDPSDFFSSMQSCSYTLVNTDSGQKVYTVPNAQLNGSGTHFFSISGNEIASWTVPILASLIPGNYTFSVDCSLTNGASMGDFIDVYIPDASSCSGSGCGGTTGGSTPPPTSTPPAAPTVSLDVNPSAISQGQSAVLSWATSNATSCTGAGFNTGSGSPTTGTTSVSPLGNTVYSISCTGAGGTAGQSVTVNVSPPASQPSNPQTCQEQAIIKISQY